MVPRIILIALACLSAVSAVAQVAIRPMAEIDQPVKARGMIAGQVVDAQGKGVAAALVTLQGGLELMGITPTPRPLAGGPRRTLANGDGRFIFFDLPKGSYTLTAGKSGYLEGAYGRRRYGGPMQSIELGEGERTGALRIAMWAYATVVGTVLDEAGEPMVGVQVRALRRIFEAGRPRFELNATDLTDDLGEYRLDALAPGDYAFAIITTQATLPVALVESLAQGQQDQNAVTSPLSRAGIQNVAVGVRAARQVGDWAWFAGDRTLLVMPSAAADGRLAIYPASFYAGARSMEQAQTLTLASGEERVGINFNLTPVPAATVSGVVSGPDGPLAGVTVKLLPDYMNRLTSLSSDRGFETAIAVSDARGRFMFMGIPAGEYVLRSAAKAGFMIAPGPAPEGGLWADLPLAVGESGVSDAALVLRRGPRVSGRIEFDGTLPKPGPDMLARFQVRLDAADTAGVRSSPLLATTVDRTGAFTFDGVPPGRYYVIFLASVEDRRAMAGWETKGATLAGRDVSTRRMDVRADVSGIVLTITDRSSQVSGNVFDAQSRVDPGGTVVLFTADREYWVDFGPASRRMRSVRASEAGAFRITGVPAGDYFLAAIADEDAGEWQTPEIMERIARRAVRISLKDGERIVHDVTVMAVR